MKQSHSILHKYSGIVPLYLIEIDLATVAQIEQHSDGKLGALVLPNLLESTNCVHFNKEQWIVGTCGVSMFLLKAELTDMAS